MLAKLLEIVKIKKRFSLHILFLFFFSFPLLAQDHDLEKELGLSLDQKIKIEEIKKRYLQEILATREELLRKRLEMIHEMKKGDANRVRILRIRREIGDLKLKREMLYERYKDEISSVLNPHQRRIFEDFCKNERRRLKRIFE
ncbi:MAG: hypothetical protein NZ583_03580 [Desulfobacterota bacterium]|nr:hypothetical protein [Thermodesulfobacteriota bacterium]MDW8001968.1 hypothetical protein [Deltaproteobacteria bacterium]